MCTKEELKKRNLNRLDSTGYYADEKDYKFACKWFKTEGCGRRFQTISDAQAHQQCRHQQKHTCHECNKEYVWREYVEHVQKHGLPKPIFPSVVEKTKEKLIQNGVTDKRILDQVEKNLIDERDAKEARYKKRSMEKETTKSIAIQRYKKRSKN